ncbi:hypothetical protein [Paraburkholderia solisilvae]|uniref:Uncharacterized protein n=1 Tax=Paraburkholderia solisilvae TaxID=624376 RepID=A0A6J5EYK7_9BURK|nr:hypothetical protein [Paraburkholderia solisilvae]CAB3771679.1 hypothetical protein LMG29739_06089 [Paraburkholderia solisilvae]
MVISRGETVMHIIDATDVGAVTLTPHARAQRDGTLVYPQA